MALPSTCGCDDNEFPVVPPVEPAKVVEILAGPGIEVEDLSDADTWRFRITRLDVTPLSLNLTIVAKAATVTKSQPILKGVTIDEVELSWTSNKTLVSQELTNDGGLTEPVLDEADRDYEYTSQSIEEDISFTISGDDGEGLSGSEDSDTKSILFGNVMLFGLSPDLTLAPTTDLTDLLDDFDTVIKTARAHSFFAEGEVNEHQIVGYPKSFGLATFTKGIFTGGFVRLKNVAGTLKIELGFGDTESDIMFENSEGYSEAYYFYMSTYDNQEDAVTPFVIS